MSLPARLLNFWLPLTEKRYLGRAQDIRALRRLTEMKARLWLHPPFGTTFDSRSTGGCPTLWVNPDSPGPLLLYLHGGAYVMGGPVTHRALAARLSRASGLPLCLPDYRLAPEHSCPAALTDALAVYRAVADHPQGVILGGDSAGGGLALSLLSEILRADLPKPLGLFAFSPWTDLTLSGDSCTENAARDVMLPVTRARDCAALYLGATAPDDPRASPLFADFGGAPPVWLTVSGTEILRDDTLRMAERLRGQGAAVSLTVERDLPHVWPLFHGMLPEGRATLRALAQWLRSLSRPEAGS
ncbi:alpha/beta hydrolase [Ponticoccus litoralis]|uniref:Alpha/beta hydrolase n=1 Tax=Ponticoccus litoralis TaxID=422297 RepID=A0AAW9SA37_9RHOB